MRSDFVDKDVLSHVLYALTYENRLACKVAIETGLRIGDVLSIRTEQLRKKNGFTITEQKTGKKRLVRLSAALKEELRSIEGATFVFEHRTDPTKHRTRQAVYKDIKRAAKLFRVKQNLTPHTIRKLYAVESLRKTGDLDRVRKLLNHDSIEVTMLYALADILAKRKE